MLVAPLLLACSESARAARSADGVIVPGATTGFSGAGTSGSAAVISSSSAWWRSSDAPDELPHMLNSEPPFRYPLDEYKRKAEGNVLLRLYVDSLGRVVTDSTRISESSGVAALDAAAVAGSSKLRFKPARRRGVAIAVMMTFPVLFRHPEGTSTLPVRDTSELIIP